VFTNGISGNTTSAKFSRLYSISTTAAYPIQWTYSSLVPTVALNVQKSSTYQTGPNYSDITSTSSSPVVLSVDGMLEFSNLESSALAIASEGGRYTSLGARYSANPQGPVWKGLFIDQENIRLAQHTILTPSAKMMLSSRTDNNFYYSNAVLAGRTQSLFGPFVGNSINQFSIRGYPGLLEAGKAVGTLALDLRFPILRLFGGWGTNLVFLNNLYGVTFAEVSGLSSAGGRYYALPSAGGGLRLSTELFYFPVTFSAEYQYGLNENLGGIGDLFFQIIVSGISF
jgi:hypothetical protein